MVIRTLSPSSMTSSKSLLNEQSLQGLSDEIRHCFPTFVGSVVADKHGFLIHSDLTEKMDENLLALSAVCTDRNLLDLSQYHKIIKPLNKNMRLMVLLDKSRENYLKYGQFEKVITEKKNETALF